MTKNRIYISFAIEDLALRDLLVKQVKNNDSPFVSIDMVVKKLWDKTWKMDCRTRIKRCEGMIIILTKNTIISEGQIWEINCANEESIPIFGIYGSTDDRPFSLPKELDGARVDSWTWGNISQWINAL
jgi:hypothetical protein